MRKSLKRTVVRGTIPPRFLATHGALTILEVRDKRGRKALRYSNAPVEGMEHVK